MLSPCTSCQNYLDTGRVLACQHTGKLEPLFWAALKLGPDFQCYKPKENHAPNRTNSSKYNDNRGGPRP